ncbi:MAG: tetratricopeptide repeat protein [Taibaiella sp.]|nr:tetratricopeptide repeat protein [Taibaiella sp.]
MSNKKATAVPPRRNEKPGPLAAGNDNGNGNLPRWAVPLLLLVIAALYRHVLDFAITFIDDDMYILRNPYLRDFSLKGLSAIFSSFYEYNYHPVTTTVWLTLYKIWGLDPMPYHAANLLFHLLNTWLVFRLATALARNGYVGFVVAALFGLHPLHVESVAWISELKGVLCATFYFASLIWYVRYVDGGYKRKHLVVAFLLFLGALFSKSAAVTLPLVALTIDYYRARKLSQALIEKLPFFALSVLFGVLAIMSQRAGGAISDIASGYNLLNRVLIFLSGPGFYFVKAIVPYPLSAIHYFPNEVNGMLPWYFYVYPLALAGVALLVYRSRQYKKEVVFGLLFFFGVLSVMLQVVPVGAAWATERYSYVSYFGLFYLCAIWVVRRRREIRQRLLVTVLGVLAAFSFISANRLETWQNTDTIFADLVEKNSANKNNFLVYYHWGDYCQVRGDMQGAITHYDEAIRINPSFTKAYLRRGEVLDAFGNFDAALSDYNKVLQADRANAMAWNNKGWVYFEQGKQAEAKQMFDSALAINGKLATAYNNRGWVSLQQQDTVVAMKDFTNAINADKTFAKAYYNRAMVYVVTGRRAEAIADYTALIKVNERDGQAYFFRGVVYKEMGRELSARRDFESADDLGYQGAREALNSVGR